MKQTINFIGKHFPIWIGVALVVVNALVDSGSIHLSAHVANSVNAVLAAFGLGVLHVKQQ